jgi:predicted enzyme related to lactoylglutathione lyase
MNSESEQSAPRPFPPGTFCWNELNTHDLPAARDFYTKLFGWATDEYSQNGMDCTLYRIGPDRIGGMVKYPPRPDDGSLPEAIPVWLSYVRVENVEATIAKVLELKGKVLIPPTDIPMVGRMAVLQDPQGACLGLFQAG